MFQLLLGAIIISLSPILVKAIHLPPTWSASGRLSIATIVLAFIFLTKFLFKKASFKETLQELKPSLGFLALAGFFLSIDLFFWHRSILYVGAGIGTILSNTQVLFLTLWTIFETKQKPSWQFLIATALALVGLILLVDLNGNRLNENYGWGVVCGLLTGISYAAFLLLLRKAGLRSPQLPATARLFIYSAVGAVILLLVSFTTESYPTVTPKDLGLLFLLGSAVHIGGWSIIAKNLPKLTAAKAGLILLTQPVMATLLGWILFQEQLAPLQIFGMTVTLGAIYLGETSR
jgi:drug/metabolite transporter (DMT)-like permease